MENKDALLTIQFLIRPISDNNVRPSDGIKKHFLPEFSQSIIYTLLSADICFSAVLATGYHTTTFPALKSRNW